jgi:hypothetical protein
VRGESERRSKLLVLSVLSVGVICLVDRSSYDYSCGGDLI